MRFKRASGACDPVFVLVPSQKGILKSIRLQLPIPFEAAAVHQSLALIPQTSAVWVSRLHWNVALLNARYGCLLVLSQMAWLSLRAYTWDQADHIEYISICLVFYELDIILSYIIQNHQSPQTC